MSRLITILCCLAASGCISHRARITPPVGPSGSAMIGTTVVETFDKPVEERDALPRSIPVTAWSHDAEGRLSRGDILVQTPLPWWQRFPIDVVSDMVIPLTLEAQAEGSPKLLPVAAIDPATLTAHARAAGYAAPAAKTPHP